MKTKLLNEIKTKLAVEVDKDGKVVGVWFNCLCLPFEQLDVDEERARGMRKHYIVNPERQILDIDWRY